MYKRDGVFQTKNVSAGLNQSRYIILHHTGTIGKGNLPILLGERDSKVSAHVLINREGKAYKLADPKQITWHAGESDWGNMHNMNNYSYGIEIEGSEVSGFTEKQYEKTVDLVRYLIKTFAIPKENILRHADITWFGGKEMKLRDGKSSARKTDVNRKLRAERGFPNFQDRRSTVFGTK